MKSIKPMIDFRPFVLITSAYSYERALRYLKVAS